MTHPGGREPVVLHPFTGMDVSDVMAARAERFGDRPFLIWEPAPPGRAHVWSYREFGDAVDRVARGLAARGVEAGDRVMLLLENSPAFAMCWFACARLGAVAVDTNVHYSADELAHAMSLTSPVGVITSTADEARVHGVAGDAWIVTTDDVSGTCPALEADEPPLPERKPDPAAPLCIQFTSGTTSRPKAAVYTHANALWGARVGAAHGDVRPDDVFLVSMPLFHTAALMWHFLPTWWVGGTVVLVPKFSASRFWDVSIRHGCTQTMLLGISKTALDLQPVPDHRYRLWQFALEFPRVERRYGVRVIGCWGMTEVVSNVIVGIPSQPCETGAIGWPAPEYEVRIITDGGDDAAVGESGELLVRGRRGLSMFLEYLDDPAATSSAFDDQGWFRTGDRVERLSSGAIRFVSRTKDMLKVGGENVAAAEIERVCTTVPGVVAAAVVGRPDPVLDEVPVAYVVAPGAADDVADEVVRACATALARFKVPRAVYVIDELPERILGKVAKAELRADAVARARSARH